MSFLPWLLYVFPHDSCSTCYTCHEFSYAFRLDFHMICNSDSIRLDISVAWDNGIYMRVSLFGLFLRCTILMGPWSKRIQSILLSALSWISCFMDPMLFLFLYILHLCSNPPVSYTWHLCSSCFATWHCIILAWGVSLTPLDLTSRSWS